jgi:hypothetical protein
MQRFDRRLHGYLQHNKSPFGGDHHNSPYEDSSVLKWGIFSAQNG